MTFARATPRALAPAACLALCALMTYGVGAQDLRSNTDVSTGIVHFDLPAQPLDQLLQAFRATELVVVVSKSLLDGRTSTPVNGNYLPGEALRRALAGTGLEASFLGTDQAIITPLSSPQSSSAPPVSSGIVAADIDGILAGGDYRPYVAMIQTRLTEALCASALTRPGNYRLVAQILIDHTGTVVAADVVESTGLPDRDMAIGHAMHTLVLDSAPPGRAARTRHHSAAPVRQRCACRLPATRRAGLRACLTALAVT
jgi:hypothetical protein